MRREETATRSGRPATGAFTLVEVLVSITASSLVLGGLLMSAMSMQKALHGSEVFAQSYSDQRRLIDYLGRDMRRAVEMAGTTSTGEEFTLGENSTTVQITDWATLILYLPGYYRSDLPDTAEYDAPMEVVSGAKRLDYGSETTLAEPCVVSYRRIFYAKEKKVCFIRQEAGRDEVIVSGAENLFAEITLGARGETATIRVWTRSPYSKAAPVVASYDHLIVRNPALDYQP